MTYRAPLAVFLMASMAMAASESITFAATAAPARSARPLGYLGVEYRWYQPKPTDVRFMHVERVAPGGPAERAGVKPGDIITMLGTTPANFSDELDFMLFLSERRPGEQLPLTIMRNGKRIRLVALIAALPESARVSWEEGVRFARGQRARRLAQTARP